jgi:hypothetical protein
MIVLLAEMAEPHMLERRRGVLGDGQTTIVIAQMTCRSIDAVLQMLRIRSLQKHLHVVVSLDYKIVGTGDVVFHLVSNASGIGDDTEYDTLRLNLIAHILGSIMGNAKRSYPENA